MMSSSSRSSKSRRRSTTFNLCCKTLSLLVLSVSVQSVLGCTDCTEIPARFYPSNNNNNNHSEGQYNGAVERETVKMKTLTANNRNDAIPIEFYRELDNVTDMSELVERFVDKEVVVDPHIGSVQETFKRSIERAAFEIPKPASCIPENAIVPLIPLTPPEDLKVIYLPKCTRVKRCSGCCNSELMSCQPTVTEVRNFQVTKYRYGDRLTLEGKEIIPVEEHLKCKCACRIKAEDCNSYQTYRPELCRCQCTNDDAFQKCLEQEHKIWDEDDCRCICRENQSCTTGTFFDENLCKCVHPDNPEDTSSLQSRRRFIVKAVPVETDESTVYTTV